MIEWFSMGFAESKVWKHFSFATGSKKKMRKENTARIFFEYIKNIFDPLMPPCHCRQESFQDCRVSPEFQEKEKFQAKVQEKASGCFPA